MTVKTPETTVTERGAERQPGHHTFQHIMRVLREDKLGENRHWITDRGNAQKLYVEMPESGTNLRITRRMNNALTGQATSALYDVGPEAEFRGKATNPALHDEVVQRIHDFYAQHGKSDREVGRLNTEELRTLVSAIRAMPCNVEAATQKGGRPV